MFSGDAQERFHQVLIRKKVARFGNPDVFDMIVMVFGIVSSPVIAQDIKYKNAESFEVEFPGITCAMKKLYYADDYLNSLLLRSLLYDVCEK